MQIFVKSLNGKTVALNVDPASTISKVKSMTRERVSIPAAQQCLNYAGKPLLDEQTLSSYNIMGDATLHLSIPLRGGHCQVPCGIFDDPKLVAELQEAAATIRKAMLKIAEIFASGLDPLKLNQITRWVNTKEEHSAKIISLTSEYCLCQRVKPDAFASPEDYFACLKTHHAVMQAAMKTKQNVEASFCDNLEHALGDMCKMYLPQ